MNHGYSHADEEEYPVDPYEPPPKAREVFAHLPELSEIDAECLLVELATNPAVDEPKSDARTLAQLLASRERLSEEVAKLRYKFDTRKDRSHKEAKAYQSAARFAIRRTESMHRKLTERTEKLRRLLEQFGTDNKATGKALGEVLDAWEREAP